MTDIIDRLKECASYYKRTVADVPEWKEAADTIEALRAENARLREALKPLAEAVRVAKEAASYNRHKREHCISQSMWSALCDQEKQARAAIEPERVVPMGESDNG